MTEQQHNFLMKLPLTYHYLVKDSWGDVCMYSNRPQKQEKGFWHAEGNVFVLSDAYKEELFSFLSWEDAEPFSLDKYREQQKGESYAEER